MSHTKGKLRLFVSGDTIEIDSERGEPGTREAAVVFWSGFDALDLSHRSKLANARRLVACWNACEGISDPEAYIEHARTLVRDTPKLYAHDTMMTHDRAQLLAALLEMRDAIDPSRDPHPDMRGLIQRVNALLAKHEPKP